MTGLVNDAKSNHVARVTRRGSSRASCPAAPALRSQWSPSRTDAAATTAQATLPWVNSSVANRSKQRVDTIRDRARHPWVGARLFGDAGPRFGAASSEVKNADRFACLWAEACAA